MKVNASVRPVTVLSAAAPERFTLDIAFREFTQFRYKVDSQDASEAYYQDGENFRLDVGRMVTVWISNAGAVYARIAGVGAAVRTVGRSCGLSDPLGSQ